MLKLHKLIVIGCALIVMIYASRSPAAAVSADLPEGVGVEVVREKCIACHEADLIVQQRLSKPGWAREVDKMIRWGTVATDAEKAIIVDYLSARFGPRPLTSASTAPAAGQSIFEAKCLLCHEADLTEQQRLSRAGWTREVEKMIRWGADVTDAEKGPLVDYLAGKYK
ncbi:MAG: hypothetical protein ABI882_23030 [Acidobacteriota bacterium]